eukprot:1152808-Pelagomonas_calceolata.AAC.3
MNQKSSLGSFRFFSQTPGFENQAKLAMEEKQSTKLPHTVWMGVVLIIVCGGGEQGKESPGIQDHGQRLFRTYFRAFRFEGPLVRPLLAC